MAVPSRLYRSRSNDLFFFKWKDEEGHWRNKSTPAELAHDHDASLLWAQHWIAQNAPLNEHVIVVRTFRSLAPMYVENERKKSHHHAKDAERFLRLHVLDHEIADVPLHELNVPHCVKWIEHVKTKELASNTVRNIVQSLRQFVVEARGRGWAEMLSNPLTDPFLKRVKGKATNKSKHIIHMPKQELSKLVSLESEQRTLWMFTALTGARAGELRALLWTDIDLERMTVRIERQEQKGEIRDPKKGSARTVPLHSTLKPVLEAMSRTSELVFPLHKGWSNLLRRDLLRAKCSDEFKGEPITFHALRRSFLTMLSDNGTNENVVKALAGHQKQGVTERHYVARGFKALRDAVEGLVL